MKIAWFANLSPESTSSLYLERILPLYKKQHENLIFSNSSQTEFLGVKVSNYLLFELSDFDITYFLLEDKVESSFCYDSSVLFPGIRIFIDNTFNNLKFARNSHISNGIVYDRLLAQEGFDSAIEIGGYHMRGWSLEPYKRLYPFYFDTVDHGLNVLTRPCYKKSLLQQNLYIPFPLQISDEFSNYNEAPILIFADSELFDRYSLALEVLNELKLEGRKIDFYKYQKNDSLRASFGLVLRAQDQRSLPKGALLAAEKGLPMIFFSRFDIWGQLILSAGIAEKERLKAAIRQLLIEPSLLSSFRSVLKSALQSNNPKDIFDKLIYVTESNLEQIKRQAIEKSFSSKSQQYKLVKSALNEMFEELSPNFIKRFEISV